jgi:hypothetical protein
VNGKPVFHFHFYPVITIPALLLAMWGAYINGIAETVGYTVAAFVGIIVIGFCVARLFGHRFEVVVTEITEDDQ